MMDVNKIVSSVGSLLADNTKEIPTMTSDRLGTVASETNNVVLQSTVAPSGVYKAQMSSDKFEANRLDTSLTVSNPFKLWRIGETTWGTAATAREILGYYVELPKAFTTNLSSPTYGPAGYFGQIKTGYKFSISINCTQGHSGMVAAVYVPECDVTWVTRNTSHFGFHFRKYPHVMLNCSVSKSAELVIPYVSHKDFVEMNSAGNGRLLLLVVNPLKQNSGTNTAITITIFGALDQTSFVRPIRKGPISVGANNKTEPLQNGSRLEGHLESSICGTDFEVTGTKPVTDLLEALRRPALFTDATIPTSASAGHDVMKLNLTQSSPLIKELSRSFRMSHGSIYFEFQDIAAVMNSGTLTAYFQFTDASDYTMDKARNLFQTTWQLGLNSTHKFVIPFISSAWLRNRYEIIGRLRVFVTQGITHTAASPSSIMLNCYIGLCDDFFVMGPAGTEFVRYNGDENTGVDSSALTEVGTDSVSAAESGLSTAENAGGNETVSEVTHKAALMCKNNPLPMSQSSVSIACGKMVYLAGFALDSDQHTTRVMGIPNYGPMSLLLNYAFIRCDVEVMIYTRNRDSVIQVCHDWDDTYGHTIYMSSTRPGMVMRGSGKIRFPYYSENPVRLTWWEDALGNIFLNNLLARAEYINLYVSLHNVQVGFPRATPTTMTLRDVCAKQSMHGMLEDNPDWVHLDMDEEITPQDEPEEFKQLERFLAKRDLGEEVNEFIPCRELCTRIDDHTRLSKSQLLGYRKGTRKAALIEKLLEEVSDEDDEAPEKFSPDFFMSLVYKERGIYRHYGVRAGEYVIHTDTLPGETDLMNPGIISSPMSDDWIIEEEFPCTPADIARVNQLVGDAFDFKFHNNCETFARAVTGSIQVTQSDVLSYATKVIISATLASAAGTSFSMINPEKFSPASIFSSNIFAGLIDKLTSDMAKKIMKLIVRVMCYIGLYVSNPTVSTGLAIAALVATDVTSTGPEASQLAKLYGLMMTGEVNEIVNHISDMSQPGGINGAQAKFMEAQEKDVTDVTSDYSEEELKQLRVRHEALKAAKVMEGLQRTTDQMTGEGEDEESIDLSEDVDGTQLTPREDILKPDYERPEKKAPEWLKDFNTGTTAARGVEWWVNLLKKLILQIKARFFPGVAEKAANWVLENEEAISGTMTAAYLYILDTTDVDPMDKLKNYELIVNNLTLAYKMAKAAGVSQLSREIAVTLRNMANMKPPKGFSGDNRFEPVGIYLVGDPGHGKSYFADHLVKYLAGSMGWKPSKYSQPGSGENMDGYAGQPFHVLDDFGSTTDDEQLGLVINLISAVPFIIPMSHLENKGMSYSSKVVIATSNVCDFSNTTKLRESTAMDRRFPFRVNVKAAPEYQLPNGKFDLAKAQREGAMRNFTAWEISFVHGVGPVQNILTKPRGKKTSYAQTCMDKIAVHLAEKWSTYQLMNNDAYKGEMTLPIPLLLPLGKERNDVDIGIRSFGAPNITTALMHGMTQAGLESARAFDNATVECAVVYKQTFPHDAVFKDVKYVLTYENLQEKIAQNFPDAQFVLETHGKVDRVAFAASVIGYWEIKTKLKASSTYTDLMSHFFMLLEKPEILEDEPATLEYVDMTRVTASDALEKISMFEDKIENPEEAPCLDGLTTAEEEVYTGLSYRITSPMLTVIHPEYTPPKKTWWRKILDVLLTRKAFMIGGAIVSLFSLGLTIWAVVSDVKLFNARKAIWKECEKPEKVRPYNLTVPTKKVVMAERPEKKGPVSHLTKFAVQLTDDNGLWHHCMAIGGHAILMYEHGTENMINPTQMLRYNGATLNVTVHSVTPMQDELGIGLDLAIVQLTGLDFFLASSMKYWSDPTEGAPGTVIWRTHPSEVEIMEVGACQKMGCVTYNDGIAVSDVIQAGFASKKGSCGGIWTQTINGTEKIVGLHTGGYNMRAISIAATLRGVKEAVLEQPEIRGVVEDKTPHPRLFVPSRSKIRASPYHGCIEVEQQPAPLHTSDERIDVRPDPNLLVQAANKWHKNVYDVDSELMDDVVHQYAAGLRDNLGVCDCIGLVQALNGIDGMNQLDLTTSAGAYYSGLRKHDLVITHDGVLYPTVRLERDVMELYNKMLEGDLEVIFSTYLKDELRTLAKVHDGKTRVIEACDLRYTLLYRMVMGEIYGKLYTQRPEETGIAVGINPYVDFHQFMVECMRKKNDDNTFFSIDYTAFDSTLPEGLMNRGVQVLASLHLRPEMVYQLHEPVVVSKHWVWDEIWTIRGGMPSGAPCTSVLNSICNVLMVNYAHAQMTGRGTPIMMAYGDDNVGIMDKTVAATLAPVLEQAFGVIVTSADKLSKDVSTTQQQLSFLKRTWKLGEYGRFVGVLDPKTILQHLMWTKGDDTFQQAIESLTTDLAGHGKEVYEHCLAPFFEREKQHGFRYSLPNYDVAYSRFKALTI